MLPADLRYFKREEFRHPDLVDADAAHFLDELRRQHGFPIVVTDDARMPEDRPPGSSPSSLHYAGRAFDLRWIPDAHRLYDFVEVAMMLARERKVMLELELVNGKAMLDALTKNFASLEQELGREPTARELMESVSKPDRHIHLGLQRPNEWSELIVAAD